MTDYTDRATCVLFGDGGGAVLIEPAEEGEIGMIDFVHEIDGSGGVSLNLPARWQPQSVRPTRPSTRRCTSSTRMGRRSTSLPCAKWLRPRRRLLERNGVTGADLGCFIPHQANKRIITSTADRLGMPTGSRDYQY